ncbi:hypothetical protein OCU04_006612 [Sclerotinia nivalis]|uniref:Uncharacterized protein n=1 Tax=Sclerotinia nivalis TaxID=352851 RepID=A0A9X0AK58_9HELO|nr:hypothetical protein OCU04_006612 [Sclerotinia nivalis]
MNSFTPFLASYNELVHQWQKILGILKGMEERAVGSPEVLRMIWVFKQSCNELQSFQAKLDYFSAESPSEDLASHHQELRSDFNKIRACFAALVQSIHKHHKPQEMTKSSFTRSVEPSRRSVSFADSQDIKSDMAQMEGSSILRRTPKKLIIAFPNRPHQSILAKVRRPHIVTRRQAELTLILRISKEYLSLNARPAINMEEELRLSVLRYKKAEEDEARKQAEAAEEAARVAAAKLQQEAQLQQAASQPPFDFDNPDTWKNCNRTITDDGMPVSMSRAHVPGMEEIRQALITTTTEMFHIDKLKATASTIKLRVKNQLHLERDFFRKNGWAERADMIIMMAFQEAWVSLQPSTESRPQYRRGLWTTIN